MVKKSLTFVFLALLFFTASMHDVKAVSGDIVGSRYEPHLSETPHITDVYAPFHKIKVYGNYLFVLVTESMGGADSRWRLEKRNKSDFSMVAGWPKYIPYTYAIHGDMEIVGSTVYLVGMTDSYINAKLAKVNADTGVITIGGNVYSFINGGYVNDLLYDGSDLYFSGQDWDGFSFMHKVDLNLNPITWTVGNTYSLAALGLQTSLFFDGMDVYMFAEEHGSDGRYLYKYNPSSDTPVLEKIYSKIPDSYTNMGITDDDNYIYFTEYANYPPTPYHTNIYRVDKNNFENIASVQSSSYFAYLGVKKYNSSYYYYGNSWDPISGLPDGIDFEIRNDPFSAASDFVSRDTSYVGRISDIDFDSNYVYTVGYNISNLNLMFFEKRELSSPCTINDCPGGYVYNDISGNCEAYTEYDADYSQCELMVTNPSNALTLPCSSLPNNTCSIISPVNMSASFDSQCSVIGLVDWYGQTIDAVNWFWLTTDPSCLTTPPASYPLPDGEIMYYCDMGGAIIMDNTSNVCPSGGTLNTTTDKCEESDPSDFLAPTVITGTLDTDGITCLAPSDIIDPIITITSPNTTLLNTANNTVSIVAQASDNIDVTSVTWSNDRGGSGNATEIIDWSVPIITLQTGLNVITLTAFDAAGNNTSDIVTVNYNPDSTSPTVSILSPSNTGSYTVTTNSVDISGTSTDDINLDDIDWQINGGGWSTIPGSNNINGTNHSWGPHTITPLSYGINTIEVRATDDAGLTGSDSIDIYYLPPDGELIGYAWTDTIGWISMSSKNCDNNGTIYQNDSPAGCPAHGTPYFQYNVAVGTDGHLSGYAWSENVGWINFATSTSPDYSFNTNCFQPGCTDGSGCSACYSPDGGGPTGKLYGWANVVSLGEDGWIRLDDDDISGGPSDLSDYGIEYNMNTYEFSNYAWNGSATNAKAAIGWVSANCIDDGDCNLSNYKIMGIVNMPPSATINETAAINELPCGTSDGLDGACSTDCELNPVLRWNYVDPEGFPQLAYQVILKNSGGGIIANTGKVYSSINELDLGTIYTFNYNTPYTVELSVWDNQDLESLSPTTKTFTTDEHQYPNPLFDWFIKEGSAGEEILFTASSTYYNDSDTASLPGVCYGSPDYSIPCSYVWTSTPSVNIVTPNNQSTRAIYPTEGDNQVMNLEITDGDGYSCSTSTSIIKINKKLPSWIER